MKLVLSNTTWDYSTNHFMPKRSHFGAENLLLRDSLTHLVTCYRRESSKTFSTKNFAKFAVFSKVPLSHEGGSHENWLSAHTFKRIANMSQYIWHIMVLHFIIISFLSISCITLTLLYYNDFIYFILYIFLIYFSKILKNKNLIYDSFSLIYGSF